MGSPLAYTLGIEGSLERTEYANKKSKDKSEH